MNFIFTTEQLPVTSRSGFSFVFFDQKLQRIEFLRQLQIFIAPAICHCDLLQGACWGIEQLPVFRKTSWLPIKEGINNLVQLIRGYLGAFKTPSILR